MIFINPSKWRFICNRFPATGYKHVSFLSFLYFHHLHISWTFSPMPKKVRWGFASICRIVFEHVQRSNQSMIKGKSSNMKPIHPLSLFVINFLVGIQLIHSHQICVRSTQFLETKISSVNGSKGRRKKMWNINNECSRNYWCLSGHVEKSLNNRWKGNILSITFNTISFQKWIHLSFWAGGISCFFFSFRQTAKHPIHSVQTLSIHFFLSLFIYSFELRHLPMCLVLSIRFLLLMLAF